MVSHYELDGHEVWQIHPSYGRRRLIRADGHGQSAWVGEISGYLWILDQWRCMGYKDGSLQALDPETLALRFHRVLDLDAVAGMGFAAGGRFVLCESRAGETTWRSWRLSDWVEEKNAEPADWATVTDLKATLTCMHDLPRASSAERGGPPEGGARRGDARRSGDELDPAVADRPAVAKEPR